MSFVIAHGKEITCIELQFQRIYCKDNPEKVNREKYTMTQESSHHTTGVIVFIFLLLLFIIITACNEKFTISSPTMTHEQPNLVSVNKKLLIAPGGGSNTASASPHVDHAHTPFFFMPIPVNEASEELLATLPGIGPVIAARIVSFRIGKGRMESIDQLLSVKGIGAQKLVRIRPYLSVQ